VQPGWRAHYAVGDVRDIPLGNQAIDAVVVSKLFQHIQDWKETCRELIRVVRAGSHIIQINERRAFGNAVRRYFSQRADDLGYAGRYLGLDPHERSELITRMRAQG
jgi:ubiquinone/menaquinone biosynthesis C-methylase UbiE